MKKRVHRLQQTSQHSDSTQVTNQFQSRPFSVPTDRGKVSPDKQEMPSLQAQYERAKRFGHNVANISVFAHSTPPTPSSTGALIQSKLDGNAISPVGTIQLSHPLVQRSTEDRTGHGKKRAREAKEGDTHRQVGDPNQALRQGRHFKDSKTGNDVYVDGDRVVIVIPATGKKHSQFKNSRANTQKRIRSGRWIPQ